MQFSLQFRHSLTSFFFFLEIFQRNCNTMPKGQYNRSQTKKHVTASIPSIKDACQQFPNEESAIAFLISHNVLTAPEETICVACGYHGCRRKSKATPKSLKCNKKDCGKSQSLVVHTIFASTKMPLHQILYIAIFFLFQSSSATVVSQLHCSSRTVNDFYQLFRQMIRSVLEADNVFKPEDLATTASKDGAAADNTKSVDDQQALSVWRQMNSDNMWEAFLGCLKRVTYDSKEGFKVVKEAAAPVDPKEVEAAVALCKQAAATSAAAAAASEAAKVAAGQDGEPPALPPIEDFMDDGAEEIMGVAEAIIDINPNQKKKVGKRKAGGETTEEVVNRQFVEESQSDTKRHKASTSIPSFMDICCLLPDETSAIAFLTARGVFPNPKEVICAHCGYKGFRPKGKKTPKYIKCNRCSKGQSLMKGTLFEKSRVPIHQALYMALFWLSMSSASTVIAQLGCSSATVTEFFGKFRAHAKKCLDASSNPTVDNCHPEIEQRMKVHIPRYARKSEKAHNDHFSAAMWRDLHVNNLWEAFVQSLKTVKYNHGDTENSNIKKIWVKEDGTACCKYHMRLGAKGKEPKSQPPPQPQQEVGDVNIDPAPPLPILDQATI